jgi:hypothetical protein
MRIVFALQYRVSWFHETVHLSLLNHYFIKITSSTPCWQSKIGLHAAFWRKGSYLGFSRID